MKVLLWIFVAALLMLGTACAVGPYDEDSSQVVVEGDWNGISFEENNAAPEIELIATTDTPKAPTYALTCIQRKQEALRTLNNYRASQVLQKAALKFKVQDKAAEWRITQWNKRYVAAASNYAFFCEQTETGTKMVAETIHEKEGTEAKNAALEGLQEAAAVHNEAFVKKNAAAELLKEQAEATADEEKEKELVKLLATKARLDRLHKYPQTTSNLLGFVVSAADGKGVSGASVSSKCPFETYTGQTLMEVDGKSNYELEHGVTGPVGYRCDLQFSKEGFISTVFDAVITKSETKALFRHAVLMPELLKPPPYRVVLQYGSLPNDLDGHLQVEKGHEKYDLAGHKGSSVAYQYSKVGSSSAMPYVTLDVLNNNGFGPQTHTIHEVVDGIYRYYVKNQDHHFTSNEHFHGSQARVFVYEGNTLAHRFEVASAEGTPDTYWNVFSLHCATRKCNLVQNEIFLDEQPFKESK